MNDLAEAHCHASQELDQLAAPIIRKLRSLKTVGSIDAAGIPARGQCVYRDELDGQYTAVEMAAAYVRLRQLGAAMLVIDALETVDLIPPTAAARQAGAA